MVKKVTGQGTTEESKTSDENVSSQKQEASAQVLDAIEQERIFEYLIKGKLTKLRLRQPTADELTMADWEYARIFNSAISEGIRPRSALIDKLVENGIRVEEMQEEATELSKQIPELEKALEAARKKGDKSVIDRAKDNLKELRETLLRKNAIVRDYLRQSAEGKAEEVRDAFLMANLIEFVEGANKGKSYYTVITREPRKAAKDRYQHLKDDTDAMFKMRLSVEYMTFINGLPADFLDNLPENKKEKWEEASIEVDQPEVK